MFVHTYTMFTCIITVLFMISNEELECRQKQAGEGGM